MIEPPPVLTVCKRWTRPAKPQIAAFRGLPISVIADAQRGRGGLDHRIQSIDPGASFIGPVVTAWCGAADNLGALAALELAQAGDVIVIACDGFDGVGVVGDRFAGMARNKGIAGIVVDGLVRDRPGMRDAGVPCFARGTNASSAYSLGPGEAGLPIAIGGTTIEAGDLAIGDSEGVVIVRQSAMAEVLVSLEQVKANELRLDREVTAGATGFEWVAEMMRSPKTKYID